MKIINKLKVLNLIRSPARIINVNFSHSPFSFPHFRVFRGVVLIILQDTQKLLSIVLSYSFIVSEIERTCALNSLRLFLYLYQMLIEIPFLKNQFIYLTSVFVLCNRRLSRSFTIQISHSAMFMKGLIKNIITTL